MNLLRRLRDFILSPSHSRTMALVGMLVMVSVVSLTVVLAQQRQTIKQQAATSDCVDKCITDQGCYSESSQNSDACVADCNSSCAAKINLLSSGGTTGTKTNSCTKTGVTCTDSTGSYTDNDPPSVTWYCWPTDSFCHGTPPPANPQPQQPTADESCIDEFGSCNGTTCTTNQTCGRTPSGGCECIPQLPPPATLPCDSGKLCGNNVCNATADTCSTNNGTQSCTLTSSSTSPSTHCTPVTISEKCTIDKCISPKTCTDGACKIPNSTIPLCDSGKVCDPTTCGGIPDTCYTNNGTQACKLTTLSTGGPCTQVNASEKCTRDECVSPKTCTGGVCVALTPTSTTVPTTPPTTAQDPPSTPANNVTLVMALNDQEVNATANINVGYIIYNLQNNSIVADTIKVPASFTRSFITGIKYSKNIGLNLPQNKYEIVFRKDDEKTHTIAKAVFNVSSLNETISIPVKTLVSGDMNGDNDINALDWNMWMSCRGQSITKTPLCASADLDESGTVEQVDFNIMMKGWATWSTEAK